MGTGLFARALMACLAWVMLAVATAQACTLPEMATDLPPDAGGGPVEITTAFVVVDFLNVNDQDQSIELDFLGHFAWTDPRLQGLEGCRFGVGEVWFPPVMMANSSNLREALRLSRNQVRVEPGGRVVYVQRYTGSVSSYHQLQDFPFDSHVFRIDFVAPDLGPDALRFVADLDATALGGRLNIEGWSIPGVGLSEAIRHLPALGAERSVLTLAIEADRDQNYWTYRALLPLLFVVAMSWVIFWVPAERYEFQIGLGATSMLTVIAFSLSIAAELPSLGYLTRLDMMLTWAVVLVFLSMMEALITALMVLNGNEPRARRLDRVSRVVFPVAMLGGWWGFMTL